MASEKSDFRLGVEAATVFGSASDKDCFQYFEVLRRERRLSTAVRELNRLLEDKHHECVAESALKRIGLWRPG